jgi:NAD(P)-dependent dehydrogenase (short-subunit alcohol dehydrogenase family)
MGELDGRRVVVTGGASGIGRATVELLWKEGADLAVFDIDAEALAPVEDEFHVLAIEVDVTDAKAVGRAMHQAASGLGGLDGLFNNAGVGDLASLHRYSDEQWQRLIGVNLTGVFNGLRAGAPLIRENGGGAIVNMASVSGVRPTRGEAPYSAAKAATIALSQSAALEFAPEVRVNAVSPGFIQTPLTELAVADDEVRRALEGATPLQRMGQAGEVAQVVAFLLSDRASYVTGVNVLVDGGSVLPSAQTDRMLADLLAKFEQPDPAADGGANERES